MHTVNWLIEGRRSDAIIVTAPDAPHDGRDAADQLDALLLPPKEDELPNWFRSIRRFSYLWYLGCIALGVAVVTLTAPSDLLVRVTAGFGGGLMLAVFSGATMNSIAHAQARRSARDRNRRRQEDLRATARMAPPGAHMTVPAILEHRPELDDDVHHLTWRAAETSSADGRAALDELNSLLAEVASHSPGQRTMEDQELDRMLDALRKRNRI